MPTVTVTTTQEIKLAPQVRRKLLTELRTYAGLKDQLDAIKLAMEKRKGIIAALRDETGEQSLSLEGFTTTLVAPVRSKFNPKKFVSNGGDMAIYNQSIDSVPSKSYEKITCPGAKDEEE